MDYGFAPGGTGFDIAASNYFAWRTGSDRIYALDPTLESFLVELATSGQVSRPVRDLGFGCHGHWTGFLDIQLDASGRRRATYDEVSRAASSGTIKIPSTVLEPRPLLGSVRIKAVVRIVGCEIGVAVPYLTKLKEALGGDVVIVATQHLDSVSPATLGTEKGVLRMLLYDFRLPRRERLESRAEAIQAFHDAKFQWFDGSDIPRDVWEYDIPTNVLTVGRSSREEALDLSPVIADEKYLLLRSRSWTHAIEPEGPYLIIPARPGTTLPAERREVMRQWLSGLPAFQPLHEFPRYVQLGYQSFDAFLDGYNWMPLDEKGDRWAGFRHVYDVERAITFGKRATWPGAFPYDFVTPSGAAEHLGLPETDPHYFTTV